MPASSTLARPSWYPLAAKPISELPPTSSTSLPFAFPSDLQANAQGHVLPSVYNPININSKQILAHERIYHHQRPPVPFVLDPSDWHTFSAASRAQFDLVVQAIPKEQKARMGSALKSYHEYCAMEGIKDEDRFPITTFRLRSYLAQQLALFKAESVKRCLSSLHDYCSLALIPWKVDLVQLKPIFDALRAVEPHPKLKRPPFLAQHASALVKHVLNKDEKLSDPFFAAMLSATLVGFGAVLRSGEFSVSKNKPTMLEMSKKMKLKNISQLDTGIVQIHLPWDKANGWSGRTVGVSSFGLPTYKLLKHHLSLNKVEPDDFIFSYVAGKGKHKGKRRLITKASWRTWLDLMLREMKQLPLSGHSIRIGGATQMLLNGVDPKVVQAAGGWKSEESFLKYWRNVTALIEMGKILSAVGVPEEIEFEMEIRDKYLFRE